MWLNEQLALFSTVVWVWLHLNSSKGFQPLLLYAVNDPAWKERCSISFEPDAGVEENLDTMRPSSEACHDACKSVLVGPRMSADKRAVALAGEAVASALGRALGGRVGPVGQGTRGECWPGCFNDPSDLCSPPEKDGLRILNDSFPRVGFAPPACLAAASRRA